MQRSEIIDLLNKSKFLEIISLMQNQNKQENKKIFKIIIENNYLDFIVMLENKITDFIDESEELLELSIKSPSTFEIFNILLNRFLLCDDELVFDPIKLLFYAVELGNIPVFFTFTKELFYDENYHIDKIINSNGETLLMVAAKNNHKDLVELMVKLYDADINKAISQGYYINDLSISSSHDSEETERCESPKLNFSI